MLIWRVTSSCGVFCDFQLPCARRFSWYTDCSRDALWLMLWCCEWIIHLLYKSTVVYYTPAVYKLYSAWFSSLVWRPSPLYSPRLWSPGMICLNWTDLFIFHLVNEKKRGFCICTCPLPQCKVSVSGAVLLCTRFIWCNCRIFTVHSMPWNLCRMMIKAMGQQLSSSYTYYT